MVVEVKGSIPSWASGDTMKIFKGEDGKVYKMIPIPEGAICNADYMIDCLEHVFDDYVNIIDKEEAEVIVGIAMRNIYRR